MYPINFTYKLIGYIISHQPYSYLMVKKNTPKHSFICARLSIIRTTISFNKQTHH